MNSIRGVNDFFGIEADKFDYVVDNVRSVVNKYNFKTLHIPIIEYSTLFERNIGEDTDVVAKEIYKFNDKSGESIALRPEFTAGVVRAFCENSLMKQAKLPLKLFSYGPLFRYERPQSGRYRQFHQINCEIFGASGFEYDCMILMLANDIISNLKIKNVVCELNFIGGIETKQRYIEYLNEYFAKYCDDLSDDSKKRLNIGKSLRILDSKDENDRKISQDALGIEKFYNLETTTNIEKIVNFLTSINLPFKMNKSMVRGLDYYTNMVFEFIGNDLDSKSQKTILAGGRYDNLISDISNKKIDMPAIGFASGIERLMKIIELEEKKKQIIGITYISESEIDETMKLHQKMINDKRFSDFSFELIFGYSNISKRMKKINDICCDYIVILGEDEIQKKQCKIKALHQNCIDLGEISLE